MKFFPFGLLLSGIVFLAQPDIAAFAGTEPGPIRAAPEPLPANLIRVPRLRQATDYTCGVCALQSVLSYYGQDEREDLLSHALKANHKDGTRYMAIAEYARKHGYKVEIKKEAEIADLESAIKEGRPVICLIQAWAERKEGTPLAQIRYENEWDDGHYVVAVGFDADKIFFMDPSTSGTYAYIKRADFLKRWHDTDGRERLKHFAMVISKDNKFDPDTASEIE